MLSSWILCTQQSPKNSGDLLSIVLFPPHLSTNKEIIYILQQRSFQMFMLPSLQFPSKMIPKYHQAILKSWGSTVQHNRVFLPVSGFSHSTAKSGLQRPVGCKRKHPAWDEEATVWTVLSYTWPKGHSLDVPGSRLAPRQSAYQFSVSRFNCFFQCSQHWDELKRNLKIKVSAFLRALYKAVLALLTYGQHRNKAHKVAYSKAIIKKSGVHAMNQWLYGH